MKSVSEETCLLRLASVSKTYGSGEGEIAVLRGIDLALAAGESIAVVGPSGSGKSTLLNIAGGLEQCDGGRVLFRGEDVGGWSERQQTAYRSEEVGFVFQQHHLLPQLTALENVLVPALVRSGGARAAHQPRATGVADVRACGHRHRAVV